MQAKGPGSPGGKPVEATAFYAPITFLLNEHYQQHRVCAILESLGRSPNHRVFPEDLESVRDYLSRDIALHFADEEESLLPALGKRCGRPEQIGEIAVVMRRRHVRERAKGEKLVRDIEALMDGRPLAEPDQFFADALDFAADMRKALRWENDVVLPLARRSLRNADYARIGQGMAARRGYALERWA